MLESMLCSYSHFLPTASVWYVCNSLVIDDIVNDIIGILSSGPQTLLE